MPNGYHDVSSYEHSSRITEVEARWKRLAPKCPTCKEPLIARLADRRFIEDDTYAECANGHTWELKSVD